VPERFSDCHGYRGDEQEITVREHAPGGLRFAIPLARAGEGMTPTATRLPKFLGRGEPAKRGIARVSRSMTSQLDDPAVGHLPANSVLAENTGLASFEADFGGRKSPGTSGSFHFQAVFILIPQLLIMPLCQKGKRRRPQEMT
jgi:hypothetical protein